MATETSPKVWMPLYIGDYLSDTMHLSPEQHGAYLLLMMAYWKNGGPLDGDPIRLAAICRMTLDAWSNHQAVLKQFFSINEKGEWVHGRIGHELHSAGEKRQKAKEKALKAAESRWSNASSNAQSNQQAMLKECPSPSPSQISITTPNGVVVDSPADDRQEEAQRDTCPHKQIIAAYHELLPACPQIRDWTPARATTLRARWNEDKSRQNLEWWRNFFAYIAECPFLVGQVTQRDRKPFLASLEWICKAENFAKIREGRYEAEQ